MKRYCKLLKEWGGFPVGHELWIGEPKAEYLLAQGILKYIKPPKEIKQKKVETTTVKPNAETADNPPDIPIGITHQPATKADIKAKAKEDAKAVKGKKDEK